MSNSNDHTVRPELQDDIVDLGVASIETKGTAGRNIEEFGLVMAPGISEQ